MMNKISFIGAGPMAEAIIAGIVRQGKLKGEQIYVMNKQNKQRLETLEEKYGVIGTTDQQKGIEEADMIVLATRPQDIEEALQDLAPFIEPEQLLVSVIAGVSTETIVKNVGKEVPVIRTMPNTSAMIGHSATAICKGVFATDTHLEQTEQLFRVIGTVSVVEEKQMHIVTGISGSGPAYVYYLAEAMERAAIEEGLDERAARQLITQTIVGAGNMLQKRSESAATLREYVTSPNGTTAAGLEMLRQYNFEEAVVECVKSATSRSEELGKSD